MSEFYLDPTRGSGRASRCKKCSRAVQRERYKLTPEKFRTPKVAPNGFKPCRGCGSATPTSRHLYCAPCGKRRAKERGYRVNRKRDPRIVYDKNHRENRKRVAPIVASGLVRCARGADCFYAENGLGGFILVGQAWDLGHDEDRSRYAGPEHARCNRATAKWKKKERRSSRDWLGSLSTRHGVDAHRGT